MSAVAPCEMPLSGRNCAFNLVFGMGTLFSRFVILIKLSHPSASSRALSARAAGCAPHSVASTWAKTSNYAPAAFSVAGWSCWAAD